jgi:ring-1,2-phenylacetyl-CoA epoxidase subunit PaaC
MARRALRDLILTLADSKRLLGIHYSDWMLRAPTLETGIAASSMAQDEWGHGRLTYSLLSDFGDDPKALEHEREAGDYHSMEPLDSPFESWPEMMAASLILDTALSVQYAALLDSTYTPVHNRVQKLLDEEEYHFQYSAGWVKRLAAAPEARDDLASAMAEYLPIALRWFGPNDDDVLADARFTTAGADDLRRQYLERIGPVLSDCGLADALPLSRSDDGWSYTRDLDWSGWDNARRRGGGTGPDEETIARVRGDKNRAMLLD